VKRATGCATLWCLKMIMNWPNPFLHWKPPWVPRKASSFPSFRFACFRDMTHFLVLAAHDCEQDSKLNLNWQFNWGRNNCLSENATGWRFCFSSCHKLKTGFKWMKTCKWPLLNKMHVCWSFKLHSVVDGLDLQWQLLQAAVACWSSVWGILFKQMTLSASMQVSKELNSIMEGVKRFYDVVSQCNWRQTPNFSLVTWTNRENFGWTPIRIRSCWPNWQMKNQRASKISTPWWWCSSKSIEQEKLGGWETKGMETFVWGSSLHFSSTHEPQRPHWSLGEETCLIPTSCWCFIVSQVSSMDQHTRLLSEHLTKFLKNRNNRNFLCSCRPWISCSACPILCPEKNLGIPQELMNTGKHIGISVHFYQMSCDHWLSWQLPHLHSAHKIY